MLCFYICYSHEAICFLANIFASKESEEEPKTWLDLALAKVLSFTYVYTIARLELFLTVFINLYIFSDFFSKYKTLLNVSSQVNSFI